MKYVLGFVKISSEFFNTFGSKGSGSQGSKIAPVLEI